MAESGNLLRICGVVGGDTGDGSGNGKDEGESANDVLHNVVTPFVGNNFLRSLDTS
jgi:hypothetical protein